MRIVRVTIHPPFNLENSVGDIHNRGKTHRLISHDEHFSRIRMAFKKGHAIRPDHSVDLDVFIILVDGGAQSASCPLLNPVEWKPGSPLRVIVRKNRMLPEIAWYKPILIGHKEDKDGFRIQLPEQFKMSRYSAIRNIGRISGVKVVNGVPTRLILVELLRPIRRDKRARRKARRRNL